MEKIVSKIAALGVAGLILTYVVGTTGLVGAAALTSGLAAFGPGGMIGGIVSFGICTLIASAVADYGFERLFEAIVNKLLEKGVSKEDIIKQIKRYPISKELKTKLYIQIGL